MVPNLILQPLTENALRHGIGRSADSGLVGISSAVENGHLRLTVYDNGAGLPDDWQLKGSAGIGLANTAARLQQLYDDNHQFDIRNRDGGGVEVVIVMPLRTSSVMSAKIRTLIVDDEPLARRNLRLLLEKDPQIEILDECRNGREAVKAINTLSPDLIFLDIQMPEMDGFDVLARVGPEHIQAIIFVTAFDQYALKAFDVHALDYLLKPFDDERFAHALRTREVADRSARDQQVE